MRAELPGFDDVPAARPAKRAKSIPKHYVRRDAIMESTLTQSEKDVLAVVLKHMGFDDRREPRPCDAGEQRIAAMASICPRTLRTTLTKLEARGVLKVERRPMKTSLYTIVFPRLAALYDPRFAPGYKWPRPKRKARTDGA